MSEVVRVIHYSGEAVIREEIYLDDKEEVLKVIGEMYDRMDEEDFLEIDNGDHDKEKVAS